MNNWKKTIVFLKNIQIFLGIFTLLWLFSSVCIAANSPYTVLHNFDGITGLPSSGVIQGKDGKFYGTTYLGGGNNCTVPNISNLFPCGAVFKLDTSGATPIYTVLHMFNGANGFSPNQLIEGSNGVFYGTTQWGGNLNYGTIFRLDTSGLTPTLTVLYEFDNTHGERPFTGLIQVVTAIFTALL
jgi:uncharacterized repeat protein (TIGR03803 family)